MLLSIIDHDSLKEIDLILKIVGGIAGLILFIIGFLRYKKDQNWKRKEFVSKEIKEFQNNSTIHNCLLMLDWDMRYIELYPKHPDYDKRYVLVNRKMVTAALVPHGQMKEAYSRDQSIIRDSFDYFLDHLSRFEHFMESDLLDSKDMGPYLRYWINTIATELPEPFRSTFHHFILFYGYTEVVSFFERFGKEIKPQLSMKEIVDMLETDSA